MPLLGRRASFVRCPCPIPLPAGDIVKEPCPYVLAFMIVPAVSIDCMKVLSSGAGTTTERERAWTAVIALLSGVTG